MALHPVRDKMFDSGQGLDSNEHAERIDSTKYAGALSWSHDPEKTVREMHLNHSVI